MLYWDCDIDKNVYEQQKQSFINSHAPCEIRFYTKKMNKEKNMKYKVGDKVRVRTDLVDGEVYGGVDYIDYMDKWKGKVVTISFADNDCYGIAEDTELWTWSAEMFEDVSDEEIKGRTVDVGYYLKFCGHRVIENVYQGVDNGRLFFTTVDGLNQYILPKDAINWVVPHEGVKI